MFASIRRYATDDPDQVIRHCRADFAPLVRNTPGFVAYYVVHAGDGIVATISVFETREGAEASNRLAAAWVSDNVATLLGTPDITAGEVVIHAQSGAAVG